MTDQEYIVKLFKLLVNREPTAGEAPEKWASTIKTAGRIPTLQMLFKHPEVAAYRVADLRRSGALQDIYDDVTAITATVATKTEEQGIADYLATAQRFSEVGNDDSKWIADTFKRLLGREVSDSDVATFKTGLLGLATPQLSFWDKLMGKKPTPATVSTPAARSAWALLVMSGPEYKAKTYVGLYQMYLGRTPSGTDVEIWSKSKLDTTSVRICLLASDEWYAKP